MVAFWEIMGELETGSAVVEEDAIAFSLVPAGVVQVCFFCSLDFLVSFLLSRESFGKSFPVEL